MIIIICSASERLTSLKNAANSISLADIIDRTIRTTGAWALLNEQVLKKGKY